jgi:molybdenum cofactor cytidylyltransferase
VIPTEPAPPPRAYAVVPACGHSTRMGRPKLSLSLHGRTVLEHVVSALRDGGASAVLVIVGPHVAELAPLAHAAGAEVLTLPESTPDMRATVEAALHHLEERYSPGDDDWWLLAPADHPVLAPAVVRELLSAATRSPEHSVIVPLHADRRGHPALARWRLADAVRAIPADRGINWLLREHADRTLELPVNDPSVLTDLDTPEDYARLLRDLAPDTAGRS